MKFVETLGQSQGQKGIFQYKRSSEGVTIDATISNNTSLNPPKLLLTTKEWTDILAAIEATSGKTFGLTVGGGGDNPTHALSDVITSVKPGLNHSWLSYISAILEHEGSLELYAGPVGATYYAKVDLVRDIP